MERRQFLVATGALAALSGCPSSSGSEGSEQAPSSDPLQTSSPEDSESEETAETTPKPTESEVKRDGILLGSSTDFGPAKVTVTDAVVARKIVAESRELVSDTGLFALVHVETTNTGDETVTLPSANSFAALSGPSQFSPETPFPSPLVEPVSGEQYQSVEESLPDVTRSGWLLFEVPDDFSRLELACSYSPNYLTEYEPAYWTLPVSPSDAANLSIEEVTGPESIEYGETATFEIIVSNSGGREGTLTRDYGIGPADDPVGFSPDTMAITVPPGETVTKTVHHVPEDLEPFALQFGDRKQTVAVQKATLSWGESITPSGIEIQFSDLQVNDSYRLEGDSEATTDYDGMNYAFIRFSLHNQSDQDRSIPRIELRGDGSDYSRASSPLSEDPTLAEPVSGPWVSPQFTYESGRELDGWLVYRVDPDLSAADLSLVLKNRQGDLAEWS